jgi:hypothetical protein
MAVEMLKYKLQRVIFVFVSDVHFLSVLNASLYNNCIPLIALNKEQYRLSLLYFKYFHFGGKNLCVLFLEKENTY